MRPLMSMRGLSVLLLAIWAQMAMASTSPETRIQAVDEICRRLAGKLASIDLRECLGQDLRDSGRGSVHGLSLLYKEYPPLPPRQPQSRVLVIGGIHGDEYSSVSIVFKWMNTLNRYHSGLFHWTFVPVLNPDGLLRPQSRRMNANGVDLNRNFPTHNWHEATKDYWVKRTRRNPRRYPGEHPLSEPETHWLAGLIEEFKPHAIVAVHAPYGVLDFDGPPKPPKRLGHLHLNLLGAYPGSLGSYAGVEKQIPVITIELPHAGIMPSTRQIGDIWMDLVRWLKRNTPRDPRMVEVQTGPS